MNSSQPARDSLIAAATQRGLRVVFNRGAVGGPLCFAGEGPGADEDAQGVPFCGVSGRLLDQMIQEASLDKQACWFTNVYKVRPPDNDLSRLPELGIPDHTYVDEFLEELNSRKPTFIIACGATPLSALCPQTVNYETKKAGISHWRGSLLVSPLLSYPHYVFPIYHPAFILREWSEKYFNGFLLEKLRGEYEYWCKHGALQPLTQRELIYEPSYEDSYDYLNQLLLGREPVSVDIELLRRKLPYTISLARTAYSAISICFADYSFDQQATLWRTLSRILSTRSQVGQNYFNFDIHYLRACGLDVCVDAVHDTKIRHNLIWPELPHKLELQTIQYTREPYYKEEGRSWNKVAGQGKRQLMRYNCKDSCVTREIFDVQELELADQPSLRKFYNEHEQPLAAHMHRMSYRGIFCDLAKLKELRFEIDRQLAASAQTMEFMTNQRIAVSAEDQKTKPGSININAPQQLIKVLKMRGLKIPKVRVSGKETTSEEALNKLFGETGDTFLNEVLKVRELGKIKSTYVDARLVDGVLYSDSVVGGTVTGRRASKAFPLGFGVNGQNFPKHSKLGKAFRACLIARPGKIFINCDQISAEDWIVQGIIADQSRDESGIVDLRSGVDRHCKLAMFVFGLPEDKCNKAAEKAGLIFRYVGKRTRHAGHYDMRGNKMSAVLAKEGYSVPPDNCDLLLARFHQREPNIRQVFQEYVKREITNRRRLTNLFGRPRDFFGFCPWRDNGEVFREGFAQIPQGTIGDNTGEAFLYCERKAPGLVVAETHDSLTLEVDDDLDSIFFGVALLRRAFHNRLIFPGGFELFIPVEFEIGYDMNNLFGIGDELKACESLTKTGLMNTLTGLRQSAKLQRSTISGAPALVLPQVSSVESGMTA